MEFSIMNNTPTHFILAGLSLAAFLGALLTKNEGMKKNLVLAIKALFVLLLLSGAFIWTIVPITLAVVVKSLGGLALMLTMIELIKEPGSRLYWLLFVIIAAVGLTLAFFFI